MLSRRPTSRLPPPAQVNAELRLETVRHACTAVLRECDREYPELAGLVRAHFANIRPRLVASLRTQVAALDEAGNGPAAAKLARAAQDFAAEVTSGRGEGGVAPSLTPLVHYVHLLQVSKLACDPINADGGGGGAASSSAATSSSVPAAGPSSPEAKRARTESEASS